MSSSIVHANEILQRRLHNQHLVGQRVRDPRQLVAHLGAVQSQDYPGALWALALRLDGPSLASLQAAFDRGDILRTHVLRPTWHFVAPQDIRWMIALSGPRIRRSMAARERELGIDATLATRSNDAIARALEGGRSVTRTELGLLLTEAGIDWHNDGSVLSHLASIAELDAVSCSGPMQGSKHTYALLHDRVPPTPTVPREQAVAELACRYFTSHGPATLNDFAWWSGLTARDGRDGLAAFGTRFTSQQVGELTYWFERDAAPLVIVPSRMLLLPNYDEYTVAYRSRELFYPREIAYRPGPRYDAPFGNLIVLDGMGIGIWKRSMRKGALTIEPEWFNSPSPADSAAFDAAVTQYTAFMAGAGHCD